MQGLLYGGGSRGGYKFSTNRGRTGEEHKVGFTWLEPMRKHGGREPSKQTNGASSNRGFPRGFPGGGQP